ncbi:MAG: saccharopine dehydrogenase family protein [Pyrinomonadaceae bacterium]
MKILVLGAGRMGHGAAFDLIHNSPEIESVTVADLDLEKAEAVARAVGTDRIKAAEIDASNEADIARIMAPHDSAISCVNYWYNESLTRTAISTGTHFCDLGGNNYVVDSQLALDDEAKAAGISIIPDCGLAPGMVSILATHGAKQFETLDEIHIRVGGLPQNPQPPLDYQLVFSVEGLINEYVEVARVIRDGKIAEVPSMTELESLSFDGFPPLEAFQTSGGTSTLPDTFLGKIKELDYKTIRYSGHCEKFRAMIELGLCSSEEIILSEPGAVATGFSPRKLFGDLLQKHLPADGPDYVLVRLEFKGTLRDGSPHERKVSLGDSTPQRDTNDAAPERSQIANPKSRTLTYDIVDRFDTSTGLSAMMRTTAFPASIIAQMMARGDVSRCGATPQELAIEPDKFVAELARRDIVPKIY